jgi:PAS domain S-box-containing protein
MENQENIPAEQSRMVLQLLMDNLTDAVYFKDRNSRFTLLNKALGQGVFQLNDPAMAIGRTDFDFFTEENARQFFENEQNIMSTGEAQVGIEEKETMPDGRVIWFFTSKFPLRDAGGNIIGTWGISRDISAQKHAEEELKTSEEKLRHAQKMEAFGQLAGGIAHDFNNMLSIIQGSAQLIEMELKTADGDLKKNINMIVDTTRRAADLTRQLLAFARKGNYKVALLDMHEVVHSVIGLLDHTIDKRIRVVERFNAPRSTIMGDYAQLQNALLNLALNARDAMPEGGILTFATEIAGTHGPAGHGNYLLVKVSDTGCGMDEKTRIRAFEPFFTTKEPGKGTGLGLAGVYGTVKNHNGIVELESEPNKGTTITLFFPLSIMGAEKPADRPKTAEKGSGMILVVDDEEFIRAVVAEILESLGYCVVTKKDGLEAIEYYTVHHAEIDAIIVDMIMPRMGGYACIKKLKEINPQARILISSGYSLVSDTQQIISQGIAGFIQKPFEINDLSQMLGDLVRRK